VNIWRRAKKIASRPYRMRQAAIFQATLLNQRLEQPLLIENVFPDIAEDKPRLILLTPEHELHGRRFFVEALKAEVIFSIPSKIRDTDVIGIFGYDDFLEYVALIQKCGLKRVLLFEAGFLRGVLMDSSGSLFDRAWCFFVDDVGFHYDPNTPSRLELMINDLSLNFSASELDRAKLLRTRLVTERLTKYNDQRVEEVHRDGKRQRVLVVEQARRDWAIVKSGGNAKSFDQMLQVALEQNPDAEIVLKVHPDTLNGKRGGVKKSYFGQRESGGNITVIKEKINPLSLIESVDKVYVYSSMLGFEAAMMGKEVHLFGKPCYGGCGITIDYQTYANRTRERSLDELVYIIYVLYQKYKNMDGNWCEPEDMISELIDLRTSYFSEHGL
jgi:capsule polysaccharide export protein KpsC/LpsZ